MRRLIRFFVILSEGHEKDSFGNTYLQAGLTMGPLLFRRTLTIPEGDKGFYNGKCYPPIAGFFGSDGIVKHHSEPLQCHRQHHCGQVSG